MNEARKYLERTERYLTEVLLPFWSSRAVEPRFGGFQTNYDRDGRRTAVRRKTLLAQARCVFAFSHAARCGFLSNGWKEWVAQGYAFLQRHFRDGLHDGYYWITDEDGTVLDDSKTIYGHSFLIYGFAEYALATGTREALAEACRLFDLLLSRGADVRHGGFFEHFDREFRLVSVRRRGELHKSLDTHMHLMEAFTTLYEATRSPRHLQVLEQTSELIFERMVDPQSGCGISMFAPDWTPMPNEQLKTVWGVDRFDEAGKSVDVTSFGHNVELAWLYLHSLEVRGLGGPERQAQLGRIEPPLRHGRDHGVDWEHGGLYVEGLRSGEVTDTDKEFWQQAEALVGFLDGFALTGEGRYWEAFRKVHDFLFQKMIHWEAGEWYLLVSREGRVKKDPMGTDWKICYHTIRGICQVVLRLRRLAAG